MAIPRIFSLPKELKRQANPFAVRRYGELCRVTDRVYIFRNITNSSFVIGDRSVAVIDTQVNASTAGELLRQIRSVTAKPIEHVINTHYHWDHTNGNALFKKEGAQVHSSKRTREYMVGRSPRQKEFLAGRGFELGQDPFLPESTFNDEMTLDLGNMPLRLFFAGSAETDDATAVHVSAENVLMSGDTVMTGSFPIFGQPVWDEGLEGDGRWQKTLRALLALEPAHVIPGHGPLAHEKDIRFLLEIEDYFVEQVGGRVRRGLPLEAILADLEPKLPSWITSLPVVWGTPRYAILRVWRGLTKKENDPEPGWQSYKPSAIPAPKRAAKPVSPDAGWEDCRRMAHEAAEGGDPGLRLAILKQAAELFSREPETHAAYADALIEVSRSEASVLEKGDFFEKARSAWERALALDATHTASLLGKGRYLTLMAYRGGDDPKAGMDLLNKVLELAPPARVRAEAEFYLGMGHRRLGDETAAHAQFEKALAADPAFMPARLAKQA